MNYNLYFHSMISITFCVFECVSLQLVRQRLGCSPLVRVGGVLDPFVSRDWSWSCRRGGLLQLMRRMRLWDLVWTGWFVGLLLVFVANK